MDGLQAKIFIECKWSDASTNPTFTTYRKNSRRPNTTFAYDHSAQQDQQISLTMPVRLPSYSQGAIHPIFEQNLAEGFVRERITERLCKHIRIDDMLFLALQRDYGIGRLHYQYSRFPTERAMSRDVPTAPPMPFS